MSGNTLHRLSFGLGLIATTLLAACSPVLQPVTAPVRVNSLAAKAPAVHHSYGWRFDAQTPRVKWVPGDINAGIPTHMDLRTKCSAIEEQGDLNACTGFAISGLAEYLAINNRKAVDLSPSFIYLLELKNDGNLGNDEGAHISTGMAVLRDNGDCPLPLHPYLSAAEQKDGDLIQKFVSTLPSAAAMQAALPYRVKAIHGIPDLNAFKASIAKRKPVVFGMLCYKSFESDAVKQTGIVPVPDQATEAAVGGHAILAIGYDDAKQWVIFRNSYGTDWGDHGYGYLPYAYFKDGMVGDAWNAD